jgi:hypothetical protein
MSISVRDLPNLIAAAVKKAVDEHQITDADLANLSHKPITIGLIANPSTDEQLAGLRARVPFPMRTIGILIDRLDDIQQLRSAHILGPREARKSAWVYRSRSQLAISGQCTHRPP